MPQDDRRDHRGPFCLAHSARRWGLRLETLTEASKVFKVYAQLPGIEENEDVLRDGTLGFEDMKRVLCDLGDCPKEDLHPTMVHDVMKLADDNNDGSIDFQEFSKWYEQRCFMEFMNLSPEERVTRGIAQRLGLTCADMDHYKAQFERFDADHSGSIDLEEFSSLLTCLMKVPADLDIPHERLLHFWHECDSDSSGLVDLEEFIVFYMKHFDPDSENPMLDFYKGIRPV